MKDGGMAKLPASIWPELPGPIALVSASPRRAELLRGIGVPFRVIAPAAGTEPGGDGGAEEIALRHAEAKARSASASANEPVLLAADTVVTRAGRILGKPRDAAEATEMLRFLSGRGHQVVTGVFALDRQSGASASGVETTSVYFRELAPEEIAGYIATGEPFDKAGAYGVQGIGSLLVARIEGCYFNVVGLPLVRTRAVLRELLAVKG
jgi:septum formation protein